MKGKQVTNAISEAEQALFDEKLLEASGVARVEEEGVVSAREDESASSLPSLPPGCHWKPLYILVDER